MRTFLRAVLATAGVCGLVACGGEDEMGQAGVEVPKVSEVSTEQWQRLAERRLFFGHQSVGNDILAGVEDVLKEHPEIALRVVETMEPARMREPGLYHARIGENGAPETKLASFINIASAGVADSGTALLKYCYIDVSGETDPAALFEAYQRDVDALKAANPGLTILHVTLPLQTDWGEYFHWKRVIRGKLTTHRELNHIRQDYNERLRAAYAGREPIFDLAHLQSIGPDGKVHTVRYRRSRVPILARAWTYDGGHLNEEGRRRIAEAFLVTLARL
jgi:hypothetical protein